MTELHEIKDQAVAIHLAKMEGKLEALKTSNDGISKQLEYVMQELREVIKMSSKLPDQDEAVKRIWQELDSRDKLWSERLHTSNTEIITVRDRVNKIFWFSAGFSSVGGALLGIIVWLVLGEIKQNRDIEDRVTNIELYLVGDRKESFKVK